MSLALRKLTANISKTNTCCIFINQLREKIGVMFGNPETTTGGNALKFYASVRIDIRRIGQIKNGEGQRYFDALRNNETITRYTSEADKGWHKTLSKEAQSFDRDYFKAIAAIPQAEINANPNIKQNTGYGE
jgi:hypothetical protein